MLGTIVYSNGFTRDAIHECEEASLGFSHENFLGKKIIKIKTYVAQGPVPTKKKQYSLFVRFKDLGSPRKCLLELLHTHLGFLFPKVFPCLLVINSHYPVFLYFRGEIFSFS
jgi:hypothetical protein